MMGTLFVKSLKGKFVWPVANIRRFLRSFIEMFKPGFVSNKRLIFKVIFSSSGVLVNKFQRHIQNPVNIDSQKAPS